MNNVFVYCEIEGTTVQEVSQELLTKGRKLANELKVELHAIVAGTGIKGKVEDQILPYGVDKLFVFDAPDLFPYTSAPHTDILVNLFKEEQPQICLMGATVIGRDLGPRVSSSLTSGLTADCTELEIGPYDDAKNQKHYDNLLYLIVHWLYIQMSLPYFFLVDVPIVRFELFLNNLLYFFSYLLKFYRPFFRCHYHI